MTLDVYMSVNLTTGDITGGEGHPNGGTAGVFDGAYYLPLTANWTVTVAVVGSTLTTTTTFTGYTYP